MGDYSNKEYASKGVAGSGLGLGIAGTALGLLNNSGNGLLGGLFGNNNNNAALWLQSQNTSLTGEAAQLRARLDSQHEITTAYEQSVHDNRQLRNEMYAFIKPLSDEAANNRVEIAKLQAELKCCCEKQELREQIVLGKINEVALTTKGNIDALNNTIACLANTVNQISSTLSGLTKTVIPATALCPEVMPRYNSFVVPSAAPANPAPAA